MKNVFHRVKQFWRSLNAGVGAHERRLLSEYLDPPARALFERMSLNDQRHSLDLLYLLRERGETDESLLQAALLHDVGKAQAQIRLWQRVAYVLMGKLPGRMRARFCASSRRDWRYPFFVLAHHTELGAELARRAGCSAEVVALIRDHQRPIPPQIATSSRRRLSALQSADED